MDPNARNPKLAEFDPLIGTWQMHTEMGDAWTTFEWHQSGSFLVQIADLDGRDSLPPDVAASLPFPVTIVVGIDDASGEAQALYGDGRSVLRVYRMSVSDGVWRMWRAAPGFHQRFEGRIGEDGRTIEAAWEGSADGENWELDFRVSYTKLS